MSQPEKPTAAGEPDPDEPAETISPLDPEVDAPINAAVQSADFDDKQGTEGG